MKKIVPGTLIVFGQLMVALLFLVFLFSKADNKYQEVVVLENNNLNKTEDVISGLFVVNSLLQNDEEKEEELVDLIDATIHNELDTVEETENNSVSYLADEFYLKYKTDEAMGFNVSVNNNTYDVSGSDLDLLIAVICVEAGDSIDDALAVISVILNRCDSDKWGNYFGRNPISQITAPNQFEVYFKNMYYSYLPSGKNYNSAKYNYVKEAVLDGLNGVRNNNYLGFRSWESYSYSNNYISNHGNRYGFN
jgi:hypothetical protein